MSGGLTAEKKPILILVVDDDVQMRSAIYHIIKKSGYDCLVAGNGTDAFEFLKANPVDVVVADIVMPGMDGIQLLKKIKAACDSDVMVMTGYTSSYSFDQVIEQGAADFIEKPIKSRELILRLKRILRMRKILEEKNRTETALKEKEIQLRKIGQRTIKNEEEIRKGLAMELHDRIGQNLTALNLNLNVLKTHFPSDDPSRAFRIIEDSLELVSMTTVDVRDIMTRLRPVGLDDYGLSGAVGWYVKQFSKRSGISVETDMDGYINRLPLFIETILFRITQEAFTNILKHSGATRVNVTLTESVGDVEYTISDNGNGFDTGSIQAGGKSGWGLMIMKERLATNNAEIDIQSEIGKGTTLKIHISRSMEH